MALNYSKWDHLDDSDDDDSGQQYKRDQSSAAPPLPPVLSGRLAELSNDPGMTLIAQSTLTLHAKPYYLLLCSVPI